MKKIILTLMAVVTLSTAMAQDNNRPQRGQRMDPKEMFAKRINDMKEKYSLNDEQVEKIKALNVKLMSQARPNRNAQRPQTDAQTGATAQQNQQQQGQRPRQQGRGFDMSKYNEELKSILTEDQYKAYMADQAKMQAERAKRMQERRNRNNQQ